MNHNNQQPGSADLPDLPTLPQSLLNQICYYGIARTDGKSEAERLYLWQLLIEGIKLYAAEFGRDAIAASRLAAPVSAGQALRDALVAVDTQLVTILNGADLSCYSKLKAARNDLVRIWLPMAKNDESTGQAVQVAMPEKFEGIRALLNEAHQFRSTSPVAQSNISAALDLLDEIESAAPVSPPDGAMPSDWSKWPEWEKCERISNLPDVDAALRGFSEDPTADNATCIVRAVLATQPAEGSAQVARCLTAEETCTVRAAKRGMIVELILSGMNYGTCGVVSHRMEKLIEAMSSGAAPGRSDTPAANALDAARYRWLTQVQRMRLSPPGSLRCFPDLEAMNAYIDARIDGDKQGAQGDA